ncbi:hypothetical protein ONZ45_g16671 [Pleurotus djamor]|nr:hypothetical protein ONZ45_g16671 [Pleurotus djamor]
MFDDSELPPPPPAYSEQEFDRKISTALEVSLTVSQPPQPTLDDEWEEWDESLFQQRASQTLGPAASGSAPRELPTPNSTGRSVAPLRVHKKNNSNPSNNPAAKPKPSWYNESGLGDGSSSSGSNTSVGAGSSTKQRPSWYVEAGLGDAGAQAGPSTSNPPVSSLSSSAIERGPTPPASDRSSDHQAPRSVTPPFPTPSINDERPPDTININVEGVDDDDEDRSLPPPPFTPVGPSLDGPPFEEVATLSYTGHESPPPSPLSSPYSPVADLPAQQPPITQPIVQQPQIPSALLPGPRTPSRGSNHQTRPPARQSLSPSPVVQTNIPQRLRPASAISPTRNVSSSVAPQIEFNPYVAYGKRDERLARSQPAPVFDPTAFYKYDSSFVSAVSSHISTPQRYPQRPQTMENRQFSGNYIQSPQPPQGQRMGYGQWNNQPVAPSPYGQQYNNQPVNAYAQGYSPGGMDNQRMKQPDAWNQNSPYAGRYY